MHLLMHPHSQDEDALILKFLTCENIIPLPQFFFSIFFQNSRFLPVLWLQHSSENLNLKISFFHMLCVTKSILFTGLLTPIFLFKIWHFLLLKHKGCAGGVAGVANATPIFGDAGQCPLSAHFGVCLITTSQYFPLFVCTEQHFKNH